MEYVEKLKSTIIKVASNSLLLPKLNSDQRKLIAKIKYNFSINKNMSESYLRESMESISSHRSTIIDGSKITLIHGDSTIEFDTMDQLKEHIS